RVRAEVAAYGGHVSLLTHREHLPWTRAVVDEALRLFPPAWVMSRRAQEPDVLGGRAIPTGTTVIVSPWVLHRSSTSWTDPMAFDPSRFLGEMTRRPDYLPFGQGPRLCIGRDFALGEMVVVLSRLLPSFRVELPDGWSRPEPEARVAVHPRGSMPLLLTRQTAGPR